MQTYNEDNTLVSYLPPRVSPHLFPNLLLLSPQQRLQKSWAPQPKTFRSSFVCNSPAWIKVFGTSLWATEVPFSQSPSPVRQESWCYCRSQPQKHHTYLNRWGPETKTSTSVKLTSIQAKQDKEILLEHRHTVLTWRSAVVETTEGSLEWALQISNI